MKVRINPGELSILGVLVACFIILLTRGQPNVLASGISQDDSFILDAGDVYQEKIAIGPITPKIRIRVTSSGISRITLGEEHQHCAAAQCVLVFNPAPKEDHLSLTISAENKTRITGLELSLIKYRLNTTLSRFTNDEWLIIFFLLLATLVINAIAFANQRFTQWLICTITIVFLLYSEFIFTVCLLIYLLSIFLLRNFVTSAKCGYLLTASLATSIAFLLLFKYGKEIVWGLFANPGGFDLLMPVGISYFIIRIIDTQLRWYRRESTNVTFREFLLFIIFPGTLIAGPIENIRHFYDNRLTRLQKSDYAQGLTRILIGIFKKIVIADAFLLNFLQGSQSIDIFGQSISVSADTLATMPLSVSGVQIFVFAMIGLTYAYIDFSAYSDMAIGLSRLFGYRIRENFNFPLLAPNVREYWKRWHMSLSDWSFRNIYFPALIKSQNTYLPLYLTMLSIGMWHAFSLSWFSWAIHHATGMTLVGLIQKHLPLSPTWLAWLHPFRTFLTVTYVSLGFIFVYFSDFSIALELYWRYLRWLFSWTGQI